MLMLYGVGSAVETHLDSRLMSRRLGYRESLIFLLNSTDHHKTHNLTSYRSCRNPNAGKPIRGDIIERDDRHLYQSGTTSISYSNTSSSTPSPATNASKSYDDDWIPSSHKKATKGSKAVDSGADTETGGESEGPGAGKTKRRKGRR